MPEARANTKLLKEADNLIKDELRRESALRFLVEHHTNDLAEIIGRDKTLRFLRWHLQRFELLGPSDA